MQWSEPCRWRPRTGLRRPARHRPAANRRPLETGAHATADLLPGFALEARGAIAVKGKGTMEAFTVVA